ncbi:MAG: hypothetical protein FD131_4994 [Rhodocyclaceae bacterium]|nr:MAG: hypothetical protein FD131_4994 [Rhodocyclaceae bacterium]
METLTQSDSTYDGLRSFVEARAMLDKVTTHKGLCALNEAVDERFMSDRQQLSMADAEWEQWTLLVAKKAAQFEG